MFTQCCELDIRNTETCQVIKKEQNLAVAVM